MHEDLNIFQEISNKVVNFLLAKGVNIKLKNKNGLTAYDYAKNNAKLNKTKLMKKLEV